MTVPTKAVRLTHRIRLAQGSTYIYIAHVHPFLERHEREIDDAVADAKRRAKRAGIEWLNQLLLRVKQFVLGAGNVRKVALTSCYTILTIVISMRTASGGGERRAAATGCFQHGPPALRLRELVLAAVRSRRPCSRQRFAASHEWPRCVSARSRARCRARAATSQPWIGCHQRYVISSCERQLEQAASESTACGAGGAIGYARCCELVVGKLTRAITGYSNATEQRRSTFPVTTTFVLVQPPICLWWLRSTSIDTHERPLRLLTARAIDSEWTWLRAD